MCIRCLYKKIRVYENTNNTGPYYSEVDQEISSYHQVMKSKMNTIALIGVKHLTAKAEIILFATKNNLPILYQNISCSMCGDSYTRYIFIRYYFYRPPTKLWKDNIFNRVCPSVSNHSIHREPGGGVPYDHYP